MNNLMKPLNIILLSACVAFSAQLSSVHAHPMPANSQIDKTSQPVNHKELVNINQSTLEQLASLKGVGDKKAQAIIAYRKQVGKFKSLDDLLKVKGIGVKVIEENKARLKI